MNGGEFDLFIFFRMMLFVFLTIYTVLMLLGWVRRLIELFSGDDPRKEMLRLYVSYQLLAIRIAPVRGELIQIVFWLAVLALIWRLHASIV